MEPSVRVTREQAEQNRLTVLKSAGRLFRDRGFDGVGIADIMRAAGLTHGGFYGQFSSKEQLATEASRRTIAATFGRWEKVAARAETDLLDALAKFYLTTEHRAARADGCPIAALAADAARSGPEVQAAFHDGIAGHLDMLQRAYDSRNGEAPDNREAALAALSTMVGALVLSRAVGDTPLSAEFLSAARQQLSHPPDG
jgi:TetR/AcrR family transcriptional regulator, transcriptional repressor for nem operon